MLKIFNDGFVNWLDRFVFHHRLKSIFGVFFIIICIFYAFFLFKPEHAEEGKSSLGYLLGVFTQGLLGWPDKESEYNNYLLGLSITGTFLLSGFLYAMITNALIGRNDVYKEGKLRYKLSGHTVIFGTNSLLESTLDHLNKKEKFKKEQKWFPEEWEKNRLLHFLRIIRQKLFTNYIVIVSSHKPHKIRNRANKYSYIRNHVVVYNDELDDEKVFMKLYLHKAREVFVLGDEEPKVTDSQNVRLISMIAQMAKKRTSLWSRSIKWQEKHVCEWLGKHAGVLSKNAGKDKRLVCYVSYFYPGIMMAMLSDKNKDLDKDDMRDIIRIRPYNFLDGCLSFYWGSKCMERMFSNGTDEGNMFSLMADDGKNYHFVIVGFNDLACSCVRQICSLAHFRKGNTTRISMITDDKLKFNYFKEELGVDDIPDITLELMGIEEIDGSKQEVSAQKKMDGQEDPRYYIVATADADMDRMWMNHLSHQKHACLLGYAEDYEDEVDTEIKYFAEEGQNVGYWGFKKLRTHIKVVDNTYNHATMLYAAYCGSNNITDADFNQLSPMQQKAWMDFYNYLYYLVRLSGCKLQTRPQPDNQKQSDNRKQSVNQKQIEEEARKKAAEQQEAARINTLLGRNFANDRTRNAVNSYRTAQMALHRDKSIAAKHYKKQLNLICDNYCDIVAQYLAKANKYGMELVKNIYFYPYSDGRVILYSPIARKILLLEEKEAEYMEQGLYDNLSEMTSKSIGQLEAYVPVSKQRKVKEPADYTLLTVLPTNKCNFGCSYCYAAAGRDQSSLDLKRLKKAIDAFIDTKPSDFNRPLTISFMGGGEPLLAFDVVKPSVEYARQKASDRNLELHVRIITNGSLVDEAFMKFCKTHDVDVSVSFDVIEEVQNKQRGQYDTVAGNLTALSEAGLSVQVNTTITPANVKQMQGMLQTIHERWPRVKAVMFEPISGRMGMNDEELEAFLDEYERNFMACLQLAEDYGMSLTSFAYLRTVFPLDRACPGELCVTSHGDITGCYCVGSPKAPLYEETKYGEINDSGMVYDKQRYERLMNENVCNLSECSDCEVKWNCGGGCYYQRHLFDEDYRQRQCEFTRRYVKDIIAYRVDRYIKQHQGQVQLPLLIDNRQ